MKKIFKVLKLSLTLLLVLNFVACDREFSSIESNVLGDGNFNFDNDKIEIPIVAYNKRISAQQINGLSSNLLGFFADPIYGTTTASIVTQVTPTTFSDINFGGNPKIESVILTIPYFSTQTGFDNEKPLYELDSLFVENNDPDNSSPITLTIYENKYFLKDFNTNNPTLNYFSKAGTPTNTDNFALVDGDEVNFDDDHLGYKMYEAAFTPSNAPKKTITEDEDNPTTNYSRPVIELELAQTEADKLFWENLILAKNGAPELSNPNNFRNYFRGLYIKAEAISNNGSMVLLNLADTEANIVVNYSKDGATDGEREDATYSLDFSGNRVNTFINNYNSVFPVDPDNINGDEKLFLKGTEGSMAVIELFNGDNDALEEFKRSFRKTDENGEVLPPINGRYELKRLINEAQLVIYEDETFIVPNAPKDPKGDDYHAYDRLYIYDLENNIPILDYDSDPTANPSNPFNSRVFGLGRRITNEEEAVSKYKLKLTDHLNNILINENASNPKLGIIATNNVNISTNTELLNSNDVTGMPSTAIITPRGTVMHGTNTNSDRKLRIEVFFTEIK